MATCDLLTSVGDSSAADADARTPSTHWFNLEQTEPLDLCLNGTFLDGFTIASFQDTQSRRNEDDVVFVGEYTVGDKKQRTIAKGAPRRNPVRKARVSKRFKEYSEETEFVDDHLSLNAVVRSEDCEDWKVEDCSKRGKPRRRVIGRKMSSRLGRKRKVGKVEEEEKKVELGELESLMGRNMTLLKNYIDDLKVVNMLCQTSDGTGETRIANAFNIIRQQVILLGVVKSSECDVSKYI